MKTFIIDGLNHLKFINIGSNSFTQIKNIEWDGIDKKKADLTKNQSKSFHLLNCRSLESVSIAHHSFSDFGGQFELENLPLLHSITIGDTENSSYNFCFCSFEIRGFV